MDWQISLQRWALFHKMVNNKKSELKFSYIASYWQLYIWLTAILCAWKVSDRVGSYTFSGEKFLDFSRIFQDPTLIYMYMNLPSTKQNVCIYSKRCFGYKHVHMQKCQRRRAWKHVQTRHSLRISVSISKIFLSLYLNICFHLL